MRHQGDHGRASTLFPQSVNNSLMIDWTSILTELPLSLNGTDGNLDANNALELCCNEIFRRIGNFPRMCALTLKIVR